jgi:hypothetical protein
VTVNISFLILLLSISLNTQAGERLQGISGSMGKSTNPFSKLFDDGLENQDIDTTGKRQHEEITLETKLEAERDVAQIKEGERHSGIKDDSASFAPDQEKESAETLAEIDIISDINGQFEDTINKLQATEVKPKIKLDPKRPTQLFNNDSVTIQTKNETSQAKNNTQHATNQTATIQATTDNCVKEKVYSLDVDNAAQYKRLEDFPFTYECVIRR